MKKSIFKFMASSLALTVMVAIAGCATSRPTFTPLAFHDVEYGALAKVVPVDDFIASISMSPASMVVRDTPVATATADTPQHLGFNAHQQPPLPLVQRITHHFPTLSSC